MKLNHCFDQNRMEKKDGESKINKHKKKEMTANEMLTKKLQNQIKYQEKIIIW